jgi:hypothetical protein
MLNATNDPRLSIGAFVEALAHHVTNLAECARRYGSQAKSKIVPGNVVESRQERMQSATNAGRMRSSIVADHELVGSTIKRSVLNIRSVNSVERTEEGHAELENLRRVTSEEDRDRYRGYLKMTSGYLLYHQRNISRRKTRVVLRQLKMFLLLLLLLPLCWDTNLFASTIQIRFMTTMQPSTQSTVMFRRDCGVCDHPLAMSSLKVVMLEEINGLCLTTF